LEKYFAIARRKTDGPTRKFPRKAALRQLPIAARGFAQREFLRYQRTICLSLTAMRFAASVRKLAAKNGFVKRDAINLGGSDKDREA
jgi:hypothetical protein